MSITVANASPLITLARIDQFSLPKTLFQDVVIPEAVWTEVVARGTGKPAADLAMQAKQQGWLHRQQVGDTFAVAVLQASLGDGEAEARQNEPKG
jgi:predicted nucleic acid-binding protein